LLFSHLHFTNQAVAALGPPQLEGPPQLVNS